MGVAEREDAYFDEELDLADESRESDGQGVERERQSYDKRGRANGVYEPYQYGERFS